LIEIELGGEVKQQVKVLYGGVVAMALLSAALLPAAASAAGGSNIASAPTVVYGQHTFGTTATGEFQCDPAEYWNLSMQAGDQVTIDWATANAHYAEDALIYPAGTTDFSINNASYLKRFYIGSNNHAEAIFSTGVGGSFPLIFTGEGDYCEGAGAPGPYDFTATVQHGLTIALKQYAHIRTTTVISASANLVNGTPVPDGAAFNLSVTWPNPNRESATYTATSVGGAFSFPLALPASAMGKTATLIVSRPADAQFLAAESAKLLVKVGRGAPPVVVTPCETATRRAHALAHRHRRLAANARLAHGATKRRLHRRARRVARKLRAARANAAAACATP
jgi:hypothetical protein